MSIDYLIGYARALIDVLEDSESLEFRRDFDRIVYSVDTILYRKEEMLMRLIDDLYEAVLRKTGRLERVEDTSSFNF